MKFSWSQVWRNAQLWSLGCVVGLSLATADLPAVGQEKILVPGVGNLLEEVGDDFEDPDWAYEPNLPKVYNRDDTTLAKNFPLGRSLNDRWYEGAKRGQPDSVRRVETPSGGLPGSTGALALRSLQTGGLNTTGQQQQDDFIANVAEKMGVIPVSRGPSVVTRVWLPPLETWEQRSGCHFAFRISLVRPSTSLNGGRFRQVSSNPEDDLYWPGFFLNREIRIDKATGKTIDRAYFWLKATADSRLINGPVVETFGWWTLGMSVTADGQVHYFAKPGIEDLGPADYVASSFPFGNRAESFRTFFFNTCNGDNGRTWSTEFIVDDPRVYVLR
jgi:hypothetical protein